MVLDLSEDIWVLQANLYFPLMCMAQEPHTAARQEERKDKVWSRYSKM